MRLHAFRGAPPRSIRIEEMKNKAIVDDLARVAWQVLNHDNDPSSGSYPDTNNWNNLREAIATELVYAGVPKRMVRFKWLAAAPGGVKTTAAARRASLKP